MTSTKTVQFSTSPSPLAHHRPTFLHPLDIRRPISNEPRVLLLDIAHKQCNSIIKGWLHCLTSESKRRFFANPLPPQPPITSHFYFTLLRASKWTSNVHHSLTNIYLYWEFALPTSTLLNILEHFKRFQLNNLLSQVTKLATFFDKLPASQNLIFISTDLVVVKNFAICTRKHLYRSLSLIKVCNFI